jgi:GTPase SAR1 family protein
VLDLSECQRLKRIPLGVGKIQGLKTLILPKDLSEIEMPPVSVCQKGSEAVLHYLRGGELEEWNQVKVILMGNGGVGKSSILKVINKITQDRKDIWFSDQRPFDYSPVIEKRIETEGADIVELKHSESKKESQMKLKIFDFAGQLEYAATHQYLLSSSNTIYLLAFTLNDPEAMKNQIEPWMEYLE